MYFAYFLLNTIISPSGYLKSTLLLITSLPLYDILAEIQTPSKTRKSSDS